MKKQDVVIFYFENLEERQLVEIHRGLAKVLDKYGIEAVCINQPLKTITKDDLRKWAEEILKL